MFFQRNRQLDFIEHLLVAIAQKLDIDHNEVRKMAETLADIQADEDKALAGVQANTNALDAVKAALDNQTAKIADLQNQLAAAIAANDPAAIQAVSDKMQLIIQATNTQAIAEAALVNTPAGPQPTSKPVITGVSPESGSTDGGDNVVISGSGFTGVTGVTVGGNPGSNVVVNSDTSISATLPASGTGEVDLTVANALGASNAVKFTYIAP